MAQDLCLALYSMLHLTTILVELFFKATYKLTHFDSADYFSKFVNCFNELPLIK